MKSMKADPNVSLVYSTDKGRINAEPLTKAIPESDGIVRIHRDSKGRKGKGVSIISGLGLDETALKAMAQTLKNNVVVVARLKISLLRSKPITASN